MIALGKIEEVRNVIQQDPESVRQMEIHGPGTHPIPVLAISLKRGITKSVNYCLTQTRSWRALDTIKTC